LITVEQRVGCGRCIKSSDVSHFVRVRPELTANSTLGTFQDKLCVVDQQEVITQRFHCFHAVSRKDDCASLLAKRENFFRNELSIDWIKSRKGFVEDDEARVVHDGADELNLFRHSLAEILYLLIPPFSDFKFLNPRFASLQCLLLRHAPQPREVRELIANLYLLVE